MYSKQKYSNAKELSFNNGYSFVYYIKMGESFFSQGIHAPLSIKPVLYFYGLSHWLKALLLTGDPHYPASTQVLAHGVSTRKRKKQNYSFLKDEIKVQKDGFYPYLSEQLFHVKQITGEKYKMRHLLMTIPEFIPIFEELEKEQTLIKLSGKPPLFSLERESFKKFNEPVSQFSTLIKQKTDLKWKCYEEGDQVFINIQNTSIESSPINYSMENTYYLPIMHSLYKNLPELLVHYLLLYNLSMICRYETEWWGELLYSFPSNDLPFIEMFLNIAEVKIPFLLERIFKTDIPI